jgi:hypothetical protein
MLKKSKGFEVGKNACAKTSIKKQCCICLASRRVFLPFFDTGGCVYTYPYWGGLFSAKI